MCTPIANTNGQWGSYIDSLLVATSGTCVTGLCSLKNGVGNDFTLFGQIVLLVCIQLGGLGFVTFFSFIVTLFKRKMEFKDRLFLSIAVGSETISNLSKFVRKVIFISFIWEALGFLLGIPIFMQAYQNNIGQALWASCFHSISSFNNAGFDIFGSSSLMQGYGTVIDNLSNGMYFYLNILTMLLIVAGGISFLTYINIFSFGKKNRISSFSKITLIMTGILIVVGYILFQCIEGFKGANAMNPLQCVFQSVTLRTAGYVTYDQALLTFPGKIISCILMFIGGCPVSTAGGIKTVTMFVIILAIYSYIRGRKVYAFNRKFNDNTILKAMAVTFLAIVTIIIGSIAIGAFEKDSSNPLAHDYSNIFYETFSAFGTVGVTAGITTSLTIGSKIVLCFLMFLGRLGPVTMFQIFQKNLNTEDNPHYQLVDEDISVG